MEKDRLFKDWAGSRVNQESQWMPIDEEANYVNVNRCGEKNYTRDAFSYKCNGSGFRCDSFDLSTDLPIVFVGCSLTDGIGLPMEDVWVAHFINKVQHLPQNIDKKIPLWSLALGGSGNDTASRLLLEFVDKLKPRYLIYLHTSIYRREFSYDNYYTQAWLPNSTLPVDDVASKLASCKYFAFHQSMRSFHIINLVAKLHNIKTFVFMMKGDNLNSREQQYLINTFTNIVFDFDNISVEYEPHKLQEISDLSQSELEHILSKPTVARDNIHPGAVVQYTFFAKIWNAVKHEFE